MTSTQTARVTPLRWWRRRRRFGWAEFNRAVTANAQHRFCREHVASRGQSGDYDADLDAVLTRLAPAAELIELTVRRDGRFPRMGEVADHLASKWAEQDEDEDEAR